MAVCSNRLFVSLAHHTTVWRSSWNSPILKKTTPGRSNHLSSNPACLLPLISLYRSQSTDISHSHNNVSFEEYRKLRKALKMRARIAGVPLAFISMGLSSLVNVYLNPRMFEMTPEEIQPILGLDPIVFSGLCGAGSALVGYMLGGTIFTATWKILSREKAKQLDQKDKNFLERLQRHRFSEVSKYEDDYYGDKVMTLSDYRQWVRQQQKRKEYMQKLNDTKTSGTEV